MKAWRVFAVLFMAVLVLISGFATIVVPMTEAAGDNRWLWLMGMIVLTGVLGFLFLLFLKSSDRAMDMK